MNESGPFGSVETRGSQNGDSGWADLRHTSMEFLRVILLRKWFFVVPFCVIFVGALLYSHRIPRRYQASTVFERRPDLAVSKLTWKGVPQKFQSILRSFSFDIVDRDALCEVADRAGLTDSLPRDETGRLNAVGEKMRRGLAGRIGSGLQHEFITRREDQELIRLSYIGPDPKQARVLVEAIRDVYIRRTQVRILALLEEARSFLEREHAESRADVEQANDELLRFQVAYPGIDPQGPDAIAPRAALLKTDIEDLGRRSADIEAEIAARTVYINGDSLENLPGGELDPGEVSTLVPNPRRADLHRQIRQFEVQITQLQTARHMTDRHPEIISIRRGMQAAAEALATEPERVTRSEALALKQDAAPTNSTANGLAEQLWEAGRARAQMELVSLNSARERLDLDHARLERELRSLDRLRDEMVAKRRDYFQLEGQADRADTQALLWRERLDEIEQIIEAESVDQGLGFSVMMRAGPITRPVSPRFWTVLMVSLILASGAGVGIVLLCELLDHKYRTVSQVVRNVGLPVLETIGEIVIPAQRRRRMVRDVVFKPILVTALAAACVASTWSVHASIENPARWERIKATLVRSDDASERTPDGPDTA